MDNDLNPIKNLIHIKSVSLYSQIQADSRREDIESAFSQFDSWQGINGATPLPYAKNGFVEQRTVFRGA